MTQPNILFLLIDDLGWRDLTCYGSSFYETPNLDRFAAQGMRFTQAYASCPVCSPTRASILSGKYPARVGVTQYITGHAVGRLCDVPYFAQLPASERSLAAALRDGGYQTWHIGKWHLGDGQCSPTHHGFDVNLGGCGWGHPHHGHFSPWHIPTLPNGPDGEYLADRLTHEAIQLIENRDPQRPFFLNLWHYAVHTPIQAPADLVEKYKQKARDLKLDQQNPFVEGDHFPCQHKRTQRIRRRILQSDPVYAAMVENLDTNIGRVLDALTEQSLAEDTIVVFTSDNGGLATAEGSPTCNAPLSEGKGWMYEGGNRVCQIVRWPKVVAAGTTCDTPTTSTDYYPTFMEAADLPPDPVQHADGASLLPLLRGETAIDRDAIYWHYPHYSNQGGSPACAVRSGRWKLIEHFEDHRLELFDLEADESETRNAIGENDAVALRLHAQLTRWRTSVEALIPQPNPNYIPPPASPDVDPAEV